MKCTLTTGHPYVTIHKLFATELERTHDRSTVKLTEDNGNATFTITAEDVTAMRAAMNGITSILQVYEHGQRFSSKNSGT